MNLALAAAALLAGPNAEATQKELGVGAAAMAFFECGQMYAVQPDKAAFLKAVSDLGSKVADDQKLSMAGVSIDDGGGRGCRVTYTGPRNAAEEFADTAAKTYPEHAEVRRGSTTNGETVSALFLDPRP